MVVSIILGTIIFGYAIWALVRSLRLSKQGKCAGCAIKNRCSSNCEDASKNKESS